jgi:hypothetical protein
MIKLKNFLIKREQSQTRLSFAECEKSRLIAKLTLTLVALLSMTTGAWAQNSDEVTVTPVTGQTNKWTFTMPAFNVELTPIYAPEFTATFKAGNSNTIQGGKATVTVTESGATTGTQVTLDENGKLTPLYEGQAITMTAGPGYKFRKVEVKKGGGEPVLLTTITAADNSSFKSGSQTFGDVATVTLTGNWLTNDGSHGGWYCTGSNLTATISVAEANGANITSVKFYTAGGGSAEDKEAPFEVTTTSMSSSDITTYLNGNAIGSYGVSKIEVYGTK